MVQIIELGRITASTLEYRKPLAQGVMQRFPTHRLRGNDGYFMLNELLRESMLLEYLLVGPTLSSIKFQNHRLGVFNTDLVDSILVTV
jgi:hypothetical protein